MKSRDNYFTLKNSTKTPTRLQPSVFFIALMPEYQLKVGLPNVLFPAKVNNDFTNY